MFHSPFADPELKGQLEGTGGKALFLDAAGFALDVALGLVSVTLGLEGVVAGEGSGNLLGMALDLVAEALGVGLGVCGMLGGFGMGLLGSTSSSEIGVADGVSDGLLHAPDGGVGGVVESVSHCCCVWVFCWWWKWFCASVKCNVRESVRMKIREKKVEKVRPACPFMWISVESYGIPGYEVYRFLRVSLVFEEKKMKIGDVTSMSYTKDFSLHKFFLCARMARYECGMVRECHYS